MAWYWPWRQAKAEVPEPDPLAGNRRTPPGLEAGATRRRLATWQPAAVHVNALMAGAGQTINARARWLVRNNGYARAAVRSWATNTVGAGIKPSSLVEDEAIRRAIHELWTAWTDEADAEDVTDFYGLGRRVSRETFLTGECFVRLRPRFPQDGLLVPLQLQILPSEQLPLNRTLNGPNGNPIRMGIEFDRILRDRRMAYWFYRGNPTDTTWHIADGMHGLNFDDLTRVPAEDVIHVYDPVEAGQIRGLSGYAAAIVKLFQIDAYDDAELERQKQQARYATFITTPDATDDDGNPLDPRPEDDDSVWGPGANVLLYGGEDVKFAKPEGASSGYEPFQYRTLLQICAGLGIPYGELSWDLTKATYASSRAGLLAFRGEVEAFQHAVLVYQFLRKVWQRWFDYAVLAGALPISITRYQTQPTKWRAMKAIVPRMPWVDPYKDRQANVLAMRSGSMAPQDIIESEGYDAEQTLDRWVEWFEMLHSRGLAPFDYGARVTSSPGSNAEAQVPAGEEAA